MAPQNGPNPFSTPSTEDKYPSEAWLKRTLGCMYCGNIVSSPVVLPCGHSGCKKCLESQYSREAAFLRTTPPSTCRCRQCGVKHTNIAYNVDVTMNEIVTLLRFPAKAPEPTTTMDAISEKQCKDSEVSDEKSRTNRNSPSLIENGNFSPPEILLALIAASEDGYSASQESRLPDLSHKRVEQTPKSPGKSIRSAIECSVCYSIFTEASTTSCGHTFCHQCIVRVYDHGNSCPVCRRGLEGSQSSTDWPLNFRLQNFLQDLFPTAVAERLKAINLEEASAPPGFMPIFGCTLSYPTMPTFLFIFEPRYRLMIRRIVTSDHRFGMVTYNHSMRSPDSPTSTIPGLDAAGLCEYGTVLHIEHTELLPDGTSVVRARGVERFKLREIDTRDGYLVGRTEPVTDCTMAEEQAGEARDMLESQRHFASLPTQVQSVVRQSGYAFGADGNFSTMTLLQNDDIVKVGHDFVKRMQARGAASCLQLNRDIIKAFGAPPTSQDNFPYWFAAVLNDSLPEQERYRLLTMTSRRQRLLLVGNWINQLDRHAATVGGSCNIF